MLSGNVVCLIVRSTSALVWVQQALDPAQYGEGENVITVVLAGHDTSEISVCRLPDSLVERV